MAACHPSPDEPRFDVARADLVAELRGQGIRSEAVLEVLSRTPRHLFVPAALQDMAYRNHPLPIGRGQTISQPYIVAYMTESLLTSRDPSTMRVLEIGTGSGYQAAVLAQIFGEVYTIEIIPELAENADRILKRLGYRNITVRTGDGYLGWLEKAPFDAIVVTAAPPFRPPALVEQLARGGRMCLPVGETSESQVLELIEKSDTGEIHIRQLLPVRFVPMVPGELR